MCSIGLLACTHLLLVCVYGGEAEKSMAKRLHHCINISGLHQLCSLQTSSTGKRHRCGTLFTWGHPGAWGHPPLAQKMINLSRSCTARPTFPSLLSGDQPLPVHSHLRHVSLNISVHKTLGYKQEALIHATIAERRPIGICSTALSHSPQKPDFVFNHDWGALAPRFKAESEAGTESAGWELCLDKDRDIADHGTYCCKRSLSCRASLSRPTLAFVLASSSAQEQQEIVQQQATEATGVACPGDEHTPFVNHM